MFVTFRTILGYRKARKYRRDYVGYLFQDYALIPDQTVYENINLAARPNKILSTKAMLTQVAQALDQVGLAGYERRQVCELSGGEQQRVAIARALARRPRVILADEPTGALDVDTGAAVMELLEKQCRDNGAALILITHDLAVAGRAHTQYRLEHGVLTPISVSRRQAGSLEEFSEVQLAPVADRAVAPAPGADAIGAVGAAGGAR